MRILKVYQTYAFFGRDGRGSKVRTIAELLQAVGHRVVVLAVDYSRRIGRTEEVRAGIRHIYLGKVAQFRSRTLSVQVIPFCKQQLHQFDVIHIYGLYDLLGPVVAYYCRRFGVPYVIEPMGMYRPVARGIVRKRLYNALLGKLVIRNAARVIATSRLERGELESAGIARKNICVRRNGVATTEFDELPGRGEFRTELGLANSIPLVLFIGRISCIKGLDLLLHAFAAAGGMGHLAIVGPDDGDGTLHRLYRIRQQLGLERRVSLVGPRFGRARVSALVDADIFVLPSTHENFGNAAAEAMACGLPAVVTRGCGIAEYVAGRGALVVSCDVEGLRVGLQELLVNRALREKLGDQARITARRLSWEEPIAQQDAIYRDLCTRFRAHP